MPIPFHDANDIEALGAAGFLKIEKIEPSESGSGYTGALFLINARGEPLEFTYNRIETPTTCLWRRTDLRRHAERKLTTSLLTVCPRIPRLLLCLAEEVGSELFCQDIRVSLPVGRIGRPLQATAYAAAEVQEVIERPEPLHLFWFPEPPPADSAGRRLVDRLSTHGLLLEPFERAAAGLREVFGREGPQTP